MNKKKLNLIDWLKRNKIIFETVVMAVISIAGITISFWNYKVSESQFRLNELELEQLNLEKQPYFVIESEFEKVENSKGWSSYSTVYKIKNSGGIYRNFNIQMKSFVRFDYYKNRDKSYAFECYIPYTNIKEKTNEIKSFYFDDEINLKNYENVVSKDVNIRQISFAEIEYVDYKNNYHKVVLDLDSDNMGEGYLTYEDMQNLSDKLYNKGNKKIKDDIISLRYKYDKESIISILKYIEKNS